MSINNGAQQGRLNTTPTLGMGFDAIQAPDGTVFIKVGFSGSGIDASFVVPLSHADQFMQQFNTQFAGVVSAARKAVGESTANKLIVPESRIITPK